MNKYSEEKISVIIPVYDVEIYIRKCLESILNGKYKNLEVICVNDGSPDNCLQIMQKMAKSDERLIIIDQENQGVSMARNNGLKRATGEFIAFVDSDDFVHPEYFRSMMRCMKAKHADVVICAAQQFRDGDKIHFNQVESAKYHQLTAQSLFKSYYARHMVWCRIYRRELLEGIWFSPEVRMADDTLFNLRVYGRISNPVIYETPAPLYYYLIRETSIVRTTKFDRMLDLTRWYLANRTESVKESTGWEWLLLLQAVKFALSYRYLVSYDVDRKKITREINQMLAELLEELNKSRYVSKRDKIIHNMMFLAPDLYRRWRIKEDPTMLDWEKNQKKQQR